MIGLRLLLVLALASGPVAVAGEACGEGTACSSVGPEAVWRSKQTFAERVHAGCGALSPPDLGRCLVKVMKQSGASREAVTFTESTGNEAWLRAFRETGKVDIAYLTWPFRANENQGVLLVNGEPSRIDVDDFDSSAGNALKNDLAYEGLAKRYPQISLWPGDRYGTNTPVVERLAGGGLRFHVAYLLRNGCHACEEIGSAVFAFDFDAGGRFMGKKLMMVTDKTTGGFTDPAVPIRVKSGTEFTIRLPSNPTTGYRWDLSSPPDEAVVKFASKDYKPSGTGLMGAGGMETWTFKAVARGKAEIFLHYARPWEKGVEPNKRAAFVVVVR